MWMHLSSYLFAKHNRALQIGSWRKMAGWPNWKATCISLLFHPCFYLFDLLVFSVHSYSYTSIGKIPIFDRNRLRARDFILADRGGQFHWCRYCIEALILTLEVLGVVGLAVKETQTRWAEGTSCSRGLPGSSGSSGPGVNDDKLPARVAPLHRSCLGAAQTKEESRHIHDHCIYKSRYVRVPGARIVYVTKITRGGTTRCIQRGELVS